MATDRSLYRRLTPTIEGTLKADVRLPAPCDGVYRLDIQAAGVRFGPRSDLVQNQGPEPSAPQRTPEAPGVRRPRLVQLGLD